MDEDVLEPAERLALIEAQQRVVSRAVDVDPRLLYGVWGVAWFVGFALHALSWGADSVTGWHPAVAGSVLGLLLAGAAVVTAVHAARTGRGISGPSTWVGAVYGWSWFLAFLGLFAVNTAVLRTADDPDLGALLWPSTSGLLVGVLYLMGAAVWRDRYQFGLGLWILVVTCTGALLGLPWLFWMLSLAGGGGFLLAAAWFAVRMRTRSREDT